ncbi:MAG: hypothetical protein EOM24_30925 [Chloroflexia bacterium]|nr:hypothetical protein [Chloroflexia bacterium]
MSPRHTLHLPDAVLETVGKTDSLSGRISNIILRYRAIVREKMPELTLAQWCAIVDANNGAVMDDLPQTVNHLWANLADAPELSDKWRIDHTALVRQLQDMTTAQNCAIAEVVAAFWRSENLNSASNEDLLKEAGARIKQ